MPSTVSRRTSWLWGVALAAILAGYVWATRTYLAALLVDFSDTWNHLAMVRRTIEHGAFSGDAFYEGFPTSPFYSLCHLILAAASTATGAPPHDVMLAAAPVVAVVTVLAYFGWLAVLTRDLGVAALGAAVPLLVVGAEWEVAPYPRNMALAPMALAFLFFLQGRRRHSTLLLILSGLSAGVCASFHLVVGSMCLLQLLLLDVTWTRRLRPSLLLCLVVLLALLTATPWIDNLYNAWVHRSPGSSSFAPFAPNTWTWSVGPVSLVVLRPSAILPLLPWPLWIPAFIGLAFAAWRWYARESTFADRYALLATSVALFLLLTPAYTLLSAVGRGWAMRLVQILPTPLLVGVGIVDLVRVAGRARVSKVWRRAVVAAALAIDAGVIAATAWPVYELAHSWDTYSQALRVNGPLQGWNLSREVAASGPLPRVVLSDPDTSYLLPYLLGSRVVAMMRTHIPPYIDSAERHAAVELAYDGSTPMDEIIAILDKYNVDAILVAQRRDWPKPGYGRNLVNRLRRNPAFLDTGCCGNLVLFRYRHPSADESPKPRS